MKMALSGSSQLGVASATQQARVSVAAQRARVCKNGRCDILKAIGL